MSDTATQCLLTPIAYYGGSANLHFFSDFTIFFFSRPPSTSSLPFRHAPHKLPFPTLIFLFI